METKIYIGLNAENKMTKELINAFEGVGLIRGEYLCRAINQYVTTKNCQEYIQNYLENICESFSNKEVWYRFTDLTCNEIATLEGADDINIEKWHFIGTKGARRYLKYIDTFKNECAIIEKVHTKYKNLGVIIPYIKDIDEYKKIKKIIREEGYEGKIGIMAEIPSVIYSIDEFIKEGVDNITIGLNDLTSLMLGTYREAIYHNKLHPIIINAVKYIQEKCKNKNISFSIAGYFTKEEIEYYKKLKISKITVNYVNLPNLSDKYKDLPELNLLNEIKQNTKRRRMSIEKKENKK